MSGALDVFARDGYARGSIEAIAEAASVSTRTIYNHFTDKAALFHALIEESTEKVAQAQIEIIDQHLSTVIDLEPSLLAFARAWVVPVPEHARHFALVRHINADIEHIPPATINVWQQAGPTRVHGELARRLQHLADRGLLRVGNSRRTARHLLVLISPTNPSLPAVPPAEAATDEHVVEGVRAFLHGHLP